MLDPLYKLDFIIDRTSELRDWRIQKPFRNSEVRLYQ